ncbi:DUF7344 domain-containing protein [Halosolutus gelatinilyticus]|uniref:DUF7344 domain-containing protein n=1 Tax=Halosolutus gelatinilyticus TaxID=2931975 RepID=UPI001FF2E544|nr:hypothetical protein [Halosolutus gelatinilyticus]
MIQDDHLPSIVLRSESSSPDRSDPITRRNRVLEHLESRSGVATLDELVAALSTADGSDERYRLRIHLHHVDLPWLEDADKIVYEHAGGAVILLENQRGRS